MVADAEHATTDVLVPGGDGDGRQPDRSRRPARVIRWRRFRFGNHEFDYCKLARCAFVSVVDHT